MVILENGTYDMTYESEIKSSKVSIILKKLGHLCAVFSKIFTFPAISYSSSITLQYARF